MNLRRHKLLYPHSINRFVRFRDPERWPTPDVFFKDDFSELLEKYNSEILHWEEGPALFIVDFLVKLEIRYERQRRSDKPLPPLENHKGSRNIIENNLTFELSAPALRLQANRMMRDFVYMLMEKKPEIAKSFLLFHVENLTKTEISKRLGISVSGVLYQLKIAEKFRHHFLKDVEKKYGLDPYMPTDLYDSD